MPVLNLLNRKIILPVSDLLTGNKASKYLNFLEQSQYWSQSEIEEYQNLKLRSLINHAYLNVPFYTDLFNSLNIKPEDIQSKEDLIKIPIITKDDLKRSKGQHLASNMNKKQLVFSSSSGSTGEPFQFYKTKDSESFITAAAIRGWNWMGYNLGDSYAKISMNPRNSMIKKIQDFINNSLYLSSTQLIESEFSRIVEEIIKADPEYIRSYPIPIYYLASIIENQQNIYPGKKLKAINTTGSTLLDEVREKIEKVFNVKIYDSYSCEGGAVFYECPTHQYYHPSQEYAIQEFIEDDYTKADPEHPVRHITTDLHNYASPFIRYDTQDYVVLGDNQTCTCGRNMLNIKKIKGRDSDILITPSKKYLIVENFVAYFEWIIEVDQIQVVQNEIDEIVFNLVVNESFNNDVLTKLKNYWQDYIGTDVKLVFKIVDEIQLTSVGKRRTVIRNPNIKLDGR